MWSWSRHSSQWKHNKAVERRDDKIKAPPGHLSDNKANTIRDSLSIIKSLLFIIDSGYLKAAFCAQNARMRRAREEAIGSQQHRDRLRPSRARPRFHRGTNQSGMRDHNERVVLSLVRQHGSLSKSDIARMTKPVGADRLGHHARAGE